VRKGRPMDLTEYEDKYLTIDEGDMEYWCNDSGEEKKVFNEGWNKNGKKPIEYSKFVSVRRLSKFIRNLYS
jgi:hypothetical protein